ncbi:MAG: hydantoinase B/oxoprolinase family protein [Gaiellales bacterium]|nr:hydantoinase B/oxoprolinase family protein [Gaiellales bacterium]
MHVDIADFTVLATALGVIVREMGRNMERTARGPLYSFGHDFATSLVTKDGELLALGEYIPVLCGATPFAARAVAGFFQGDVHEGDVYLVNDPFSMDAGNQLADWCIVCPAFYHGKHVMWLANKAHQQDTGGGLPGGYNPGALDIWAEGLRIPPLRLMDRGRWCSDALDLVLANVRNPELQRGDLLSMIGAARTGERRLQSLYAAHGAHTLELFQADLLEYGEQRMRQEVAGLPDGTYHGELSGGRGSALIACDLIVAGEELTVDLSGSGGQVPLYINSPIANTTSCVHMALLTAIGRHIEYRSGGCFRPVSIVTRPGTIVHAAAPATQGNCTNFCAKQIIEVVWDALAKAAPHLAPAGWGSINYWVFSGHDPRRNTGYSSPDFQACSSGAGAVWGVDGWSANGPSICSGTLHYPEVEVAETLYPIVWERWQYATDSGGPGRWRGGLGVDNIWVADSGSEPVYLAYAAEPYGYPVAPAVAGGSLPKSNTKTLCFSDGTFENEREARAKLFYKLRSGDRVLDYTQGGAGVGDPLERDRRAVVDDVRDELVSLESARDAYGVVIAPLTLKIDEEATAALRAMRRRGRGGSRRGWSQPASVNSTVVTEGGKGLRLTVGEVGTA